VGLRSMIPFHRATARLRRDLGLPRRSAGATAARQAREGWPILHGYSPAVLPRPADWRPGLEVVGYWWPAPVPWEPPGRLVDFLAAGPPPVLVGFGSMAGGHGAQLLPLVLAALRAAGVRGILQAGRAGLGADGPDLGPDVIAIGDAPHEWLLPRVAAVVHHAGAGTTGSTLRAGVPSVPTPVFADQPLWSKRLVELGCAPPAGRRPGGSRRRTAGARGSGWWTGSRRAGPPPPSRAPARRLPRWCGRRPCGAGARGGPRPARAAPRRRRPRRRPASARARRAGRAVPRAACAPSAGRAR